MTTVSVIVIFYNAGPFLNDAIQSVLHQTSDAWELLLVDDGSTDESRDRAQYYAGREPTRVRYLQHPSHDNRGMSVARNLGIEHANGEYICFLDADDALEPTALERQVTILESTPEVAMVYGALQYWYSWTGNARDQGRDFVRGPGIAANRVIYPPELLIRFLGREIPAPSGMLVRRSVALAVGGYEEAFHDLYEDQAFCAKICLKQPVFVASECWYKYRQHPNSHSAVANRSKGYEIGRLAFLKWLQGFLIREECTNSDLWRTLRREFWLYQHPRLHTVWRRVRRAMRRLRA